MDAVLPAIFPIRLLVVDDSDDIRQSVVDCLREEGYSVSEARDGAEALRVFDRLGADLILMDIQMPLMNGIDAARELRRRDISLAIFAFTGTPDAIGEARHLFTALLPKPMRLPRLCEALEAYFKAQRRH
jgi:CheY-like chemotaxis protein